LLALAIVAAVAAVACAFGMRLLRLDRQLQFASFLERAVFGAAVGLGATAYVILGLGLGRALYPWTIITAIVVLAVISWRDLGQLLRGIGRGLRAFIKQQPSVGGIAATVFILATFVLAILGALAPSSSNDWDGLSYHLAVPKIYLQSHAVHYIPWLSHSNFPFTMEMLYAAGLGLGGQAGAKLFHTLCAVLIVLAMMSFGAAHWERRHGALAAVIFLAMPVVAWEATSGMNDLGLALFTLLGLYAFINWWSGRAGRWLLVAGALCGLALGVKATAGVLAGFLAVAAFYHRTVSERTGAAAGLRAAAALIVIGVAVASPWYIKSYIWTGNPVYPFLYEWFGGKYWTAEGARAYRQEQLGFGMGRGPLAFILAPWNLTMYGHRFSNLPGRPLIYTSIAPLLLAFLPGLLVLGKLDRRVKFLLLYSLAAFCAWFVLSQHIRYAIPLLPPLALCAGFAGSEIFGKARKELRPVAMGAVIIVCIISSAIFCVLVSDAIPAAVGLESQSAYLARTLDGLYPMAQVVNALPGGSKVIMYGETMGFYFDTPYMWGGAHHNMIPYDRLHNANQLLAAYRRLGVTHVLMTTQFYAIAQQRRGKVEALLDDCLREGMLAEPVQRGNYLLMRIVERPS
jgi:4-amino-4-deoxy-L-arabinose transferase-like glycosyltransferase